MDSFFDATLFKALRIDDNEYQFASYLFRICDLLSKYSWIYEARNIDIYIYGVLEKIPLEWGEVLLKLDSKEQKQLPFGFIKSEWPTSLQDFLKECNQLSKLRFSDVKYQDIIKTKSTLYLKETTPKKLSEIDTMSHFVYEICQALKCNKVLDVGSGLGYMGQALHTNFGICSIGIEVQPKYTKTALRRLKKEPCHSAVYYENFSVDRSEECVSRLKKVMEIGERLHCNCYNDKKITNEKESREYVMIGLHTCGDLSLDMIKLFLQLEEFVSFICIGCCYNKMDLSVFPLSTVAKSAVENAQSRHPSWSPCVQGLRLASHGTRSNFSTFPIQLERQLHMFYRSLLEYFLQKEKIIWKQPKRHVTICNPSDIFGNFRKYCADMFADHKLRDKEGAFQKLDDLFLKKFETFDRIKILLILQTILQPVWEIFVVMDRLLYFRENNITAEVVEMWNDSMSSRNLALIASKKQFTTIASKATST